MPWNASTLKWLRERAGLTQQQLADAAGIHRVTIAKLESSTARPGIDVVEALAKALRVEVTVFLK
jgi:transcriptional regulator with XRE-family HTH domain